VLPARLLTIKQPSQNPFLGTWIAISGESGSNKTTRRTTTIGD
jgi:hypothetical protein